MSTIVPNSRIIPPSKDDHSRPSQDRKTMFGRFGHADQSQPRSTRSINDSQEYDSADHDNKHKTTSFEAPDDHHRKVTIFS
ncbi:hypothetical protein CLU79DRAFT_768447 [Phycomyces nitens]|nr:hypothetical protein CLU79DRAFT_768447 [Phycomyces nitens]